MNNIIISLLIVCSTTLAAQAIPSKNTTMYLAPIGSQVFINGDHASTADLVINGSLFVASSINGGSLIIDGSTLIDSPSDFFRNGGENGGSNRSLGNLDAQGLTLITNNAAALSIDDNGYVGIGVSSPSYKLDVNGSLKASGNLNLNGATADLGALSLAGSIAIAEGSAPSSTSGYGKIYVSSANNHLYFIDNGGAATDLHTTAGGGGAGTALTNLDNVAINTSLISDTDNTDDLGSSSIGWRDLWLSGSGYFAQYLYHDGDTDTFIEYATDAMSVNAGGEMFINILEDGSQDLIKFGDNGDIDIKLSAGADAALFVNGATSNVGIGTTGANEKLTVDGALALRETARPDGASGYGKLYVNGTNLNLYFVNGDGEETDLLSGIGGGATAIDGLSDGIFSGGSTSVYLGNGAGASSASSVSNTALGINGLAAINGGDNNTTVGYSSGSSISTGNGNIAIGFQAGDNLDTGNGNIIIGNDIDAPVASDSNQLNIANLIFGTSIDETGTSVSDGNVGIGINNPSYRMHVNGTLAVTQAATFSSTINNVTISPRTSTATLRLANGSTLITSGANSVTLSSTGTTTVTLPTTGTLATLNGAEFLSSKTLVAPTLSGNASVANITSATGTINGYTIIADSKFFFQGGSPSSGKYLQAQGTNGSAAWVTTTFIDELADDSSPNLSVALDANGYDLDDVGDIALDSISSAASTINVVTGNNDFKINGSTLVVEGDDSQVGINAANPGYQLQVNGSFAVTQAATFSSTINNVTISPRTSTATLRLANGSTLITSGANSVTLSSTGTTTVTLPTTGTLATLNGAEFLSSKTLVAPTLSGNASVANITSATGTINGYTIIADSKFFFQGGSPSSGQFLQAQASNGKAAWTSANFELAQDTDPDLSQVLDANGYDLDDVGDIALDSISSAASTINVVTGNNDFKINGSTLVVEGDDSQVGINAANPAYQLQVNGNVTVIGGSTTLAGLSATTGTFSSTLTSTGDFTVTNSSTFQVQAGNGDTTIGGTLSAPSATITSLSASAATINGSIASVNTLAVSTISSENGTSLNIDLGSSSGNDFTVNGNYLVVEGDTGYVGIGKSAPTKALDVVGSGYFTGDITVNGDLLVGNDTADGALDIRDGNGTFLFNGSSVDTAYTTTFWMDDTGLSIGHNHNNRRLDLQTDSTTRLSIAANGDVGIGTSTPHSKLTVNTSTNGDVLWLSDDSGSTYCEANPSSSFTWQCTSDSRLKKNIRSSKPILPDLMKFKIKDFTIINTGERSTGVIAQEVQEIFPHMVSTGDNGYLRVDTLNQWQLVKAIQELKTENDLIEKIVCKDHPEEAICKDAN